VSARHLDPFGPHEQHYEGTTQPRQGFDLGGPDHEQPSSRDENVLHLKFRPLDLLDVLSEHSDLVF
jgi:hypothetical protein